MEKLGQDDIDHSQRRVVCISQDAFYKNLTDEEATKASKVGYSNIVVSNTAISLHLPIFVNWFVLKSFYFIFQGQFNFDHPDAFNSDLILQSLKKIQAGQICNIPDYDYVTNSS